MAHFNLYNDVYKRSDTEKCPYIVKYDHANGSVYYAQTTHGLVIEVKEYVKETLPYILSYMFREELPDSCRPTFLDLPYCGVPLLKEAPRPPDGKTFLTSEIVTYITSLKGSIENIKKQSPTKESA